MFFLTKKMQKHHFKSSSSSAPGRCVLWRCCFRYISTSNLGRDVWPELTGRCCFCWCAMPGIMKSLKLPSLQTKIALKNEPSQKESSLPTIYFQVPCLFLGGVAKRGIKQCNVEGCSLQWYVVWVGITVPFSRTRVARTIKWQYEILSYATWSSWHHDLGELSIERSVKSWWMKMISNDLWANWSNRMTSVTATNRENW